MTRGGKRYTQQVPTIPRATRTFFLLFFHTPLGLPLVDRGANKIGVFMPSDTLGHFRTFPQIESPKQVAPFIDCWHADR